MHGRVGVRVRGNYSPSPFNSQPSTHSDPHLCLSSVASLCFLLCCCLVSCFPCTACCADSWPAVLIHVLGVAVYLFTRIPLAAPLVAPCSQPCSALRSLLCQSRFALRNPSWTPHSPPPRPVWACSCVGCPVLRQCSFRYQQRTTIHSQEVSREPEDQITPTHEIYPLRFIYPLVRLVRSYLPQNLCAGLNRATMKCQAHGRIGIAR